jgi:hypothetical protein
VLPQHLVPIRQCLETFLRIKVKCTLVQALRFCTGRTAHRGSRGIALPFLDHGTRRGLGVSVTPRPLFTPGIDPVPIVQEAGWAPGRDWTGADNLALPTGIRSPDRPARSQSLYRLRQPAHFLSIGTSKIILHAYENVTGRKKSLVRSAYVYQMTAQLLARQFICRELKYASLYRKQKLKHFSTFYYYYYYYYYCLTQLFCI